MLAACCRLCWLDAIYGSRLIDDGYLDTVRQARFMAGEVVINKMGGGIDVAMLRMGATLSTMGGGHSCGQT